MRAHFEKHAPEGVTVDVQIGHGGKPFYADPHSAGGSIPIIQDMKEILGVEALMLGLALPDCQIHAPNENFWVENFQAGIKLNKALLEELAK